MTWKSPWILKAPCHFQRVGQVEFSNGILGSMLDTMIGGTPIHWDYYLIWSDLTPNRFLNHSSSMSSLVHFLSLESCLIERVVLCLKCFFLSIGVLIFWHTLDENSELNTFLYYLFAYDDTHYGMGFVLYGGRDM